jgi:hypothetical protein
LSDATPIPPCGITELGDIEDYSVQLIHCLPVIEVGTITPNVFCAGSTIQIPFNVSLLTLIRVTSSKLACYAEANVILGSIQGNQMGDYSMSVNLPPDFRLGIIVSL